MGIAKLPRREFVRGLPALAAGLASAATTTTLSGCAGTRYLAPETTPEGLIGLLRPVEEDGAAFVQTADMERPIYLHRTESGAWAAVLASCTHRGCQPEPFDGRLVCPCHGSEFSLAGEVLEGPADEPLVRYEVVQDADRLIIRTDGGRR